MLEVVKEWIGNQSVLISQSWENSLSKNPQVT